MAKQSVPSARDLDPASIDRRTKLFKQLIYPHKGMIYKICIDFTRTKQDIEDNYNSALLALFRFVESYNPDKPVKTWIYVVVVRLVIENNKRNSKILLKDNINIETIKESSTDDQIGANSMGLDNYTECYNDDILSAIESLTPILKEALLLQQAGYRVEEIVEISFQNGNLQSKSCDTIKSRIFLAKKQMRKLLTPLGERRKDNNE